ncbi:hypothetical protein [Cupriavidus necator]
MKNGQMWVLMATIYLAPHASFDWAIGSSGVFVVLAAIALWRRE